MTVHLTFSLFPVLDLLSALMVSYWVVRYCDRPRWVVGVWLVAIWTNLLMAGANYAPYLIPR